MENMTFLNALKNHKFMVKKPNICVFLRYQISVTE